MHHCPSPGGSETPSIEIAERLSQWIIILYSKMDSSAGVPCRRAVFDIAQAHLMAKKRSNPRPGILGDVECVSNCYREPHATSFSSCADDEDWKLGRRGLNRAQQYALNGDLASALKLYELTIELLIRYLKSCAINNSNEKDHIASVEQTVQQTLSDAESIKARLATNAKPQPNTGPQRQCKSSSPDSLSSSSFRSLSKALMSALVGGASSQQLPQKQRPQQSSNWTNSHQQLIARPRPPATTIKPTNNTSTTDLTVGATTAARNSSSSSDALVVDTILSEFWVDPGRVQKTTWSDIAGLKACQQSLQESALLPLLRPDLCTGLRQPQHILLYGPPGTGKTLLVRAVAHESQSNLFVGTSSALMSKWMGEAEKLVRMLFKVARDMAPSILFLDEIDALLGSRLSENEHEASRRLKTEFMIQVDGIMKLDETNGRHLLLLACTNCPWDVDSAVMRRFPRRTFVSLPDKDARHSLIAKLLQKTGKHSISPREVDILVEKTNNFTCADIAAIASQASFGPLRSLGDMNAIRRCKATDVRPVQFRDFEAVFAKGATKSVTDAQLQKYDDWQKQQQMAL